jgi:hypothetical protein
MKFPELPKWQLIAIPVVAIIIGVFYFGKYYVAAELIRANDRIEALQEDLRTLHGLLDEEKSRVTVAEREADIVRRANALLRDSERQRQDEIASLQADLDFYRRLSGANGSQAPLAVHYLEVQPTQSPRVFRIIISLTQNQRWAAAISGHVELALDGIRDGAAEHLTNEQLLPESHEPLSFQFKYFEQLERLITLPEGFTANRLIIQLKSSGLKTPVEQSMQWDDLINRSLTSPPTGEEPLSLRRNVIEKTAINRHS